MDSISEYCESSEVQTVVKDRLGELISLPVQDYDFTRELYDIDLDHELDQLAKHGLLYYLGRLGNDIRNPSRQILAGRIVCLILELSCPRSIDDVLTTMGGRFRDDVIKFYREHSKTFDSMLLSGNHKMIEFHDWFSAMSLVDTYLTKNKFKGKIIETPAQMHLRVAVEVQMGNGLSCVREMFEDLCSHRYSMASPALFNACFHKANLSSCFLLSVDDDLDSISECIKKTMKISKCKGGIGADINSLRSSTIGYDGHSNSITEWMKGLDQVTRMVNQTGRRPGAMTTCVQIHNYQVDNFIESVRKSGDHNQRVENLNITLMIPKLFWKRVREDGEWTTFCSKLVKGLDTALGDEYERLYLQYEQDDTIEYKSRGPAKELLAHICNIQKETGMPYILNKESINFKSNQVNMRLIRGGTDNLEEGVPVDDCHLDVIRTSNLCQEIMEQTPKDEVACCNLGQMSLPSYVTSGDEPTFNFSLFGSKVRAMIDNLDTIIDTTYYPVPEAEVSNMRHRPTGLGVSGYADMMAMMNYCYDSSQGERLNKQVFACMYFNAVAQSVYRSHLFGRYPKFENSPASEGKLQFDLWADEFKWLKERNLEGKTRKEEDDEPVDPLEWGQSQLVLGDLTFEPSWSHLREMVMKYGLRNSQLIAIMPSASTSRIMRNAESVEKLHALIGTRSFINSTFPIVERNLYYELHKIGLWNDDVVDVIQCDGGSAALLKDFVIDWGFVEENDHDKIEVINHIVNKYRTAFETKMKVTFKHHADRERYVCQSASSNCYMKDPTTESLMGFHLFVESLGKKTGMYYLRQLPTSKAPQITISQDVKDWVNNKSNGVKKSNPVRKVECTDEVCVSCTS